MQTSVWSGDHSSSLGHCKDGKPVSCQAWLAFVTIFYLCKLCKYVLKSVIFCTRYTGEQRECKTFPPGVIWVNFVGCSCPSWLFRPGLPWLPAHWGTGGDRWSSGDFCCINLLKKKKFVDDLAVWCVWFFLRLASALCNLKVSDFSNLNLHKSWIIWPVAWVFYYCVFLLLLFW